MSKARTPNYIEGISAQSSITGENEYLTSTDGALDITANDLDIRNLDQSTDNVDVNLGQTLDSDNTKTVTSSDAQPGNPWVGDWVLTRDSGYVRLLTVLAASNTTNGGIFTFEFSETGTEVALGDAPISETRVIDDFETVRDFDLINAGAYYRVAFEPAVALSSDLVFITTILRKQNDGAFVRLANQEIEEANAAMPQQFAYLKGFNAVTHKSVNIRPDETGAIRTADDRFNVTQAGSIRTTGIRDDVSITFIESTHEDEIDGIVDDGSVNGTATFNATEGRVDFAVPTTANSTAIFRSNKVAVYEPGHTVRAEQTIEVSALPTGNAFIEWGVGDGDNSIGYRLDSAGLKVIRRKNTVLESSVLQTAWNRDKCDGTNGSQFLFNFEPQALDPTKNNRYVEEYEWLGVAPPDYYLVAPNKRQINIHTEEYPNNNTGTTVPDPRLPLYVHISNGTSGQALTVSSGSWRIGTSTDSIITYGRQPDKDFVPSKADGTVLTDTTFFTVGQTRTFTSNLTDADGWFDSDGWSTIEILIATDQISANNGITLEFTDDINVATPIARASETFTFGTADVTRGYTAVTRSVRLDGFRLSYTNGGTTQGSFFCQVNVRISPSGPPLNSLESDIDSTSTAQMSRSGIFAKNDANAYDLIKRGDLGGFRASIYEQEAELQQKSLDTQSNNATSVGTTAVQLDTSQLANRKYITISNDDSNRAAYYGTSAGVTTSNGIPLPPETSHQQEWSDNLDIYAIVATSTASVRLSQTGGTV